MALVLDENRAVHPGEQLTSGYSEYAPDDIATFHPVCGSHCMSEMVTSEPQQITQ